MKLGAPGSFKLRTQIMSLRVLYSLVQIRAAVRDLVHPGKAPTGVSQPLDSSKGE